jgi:hypothetical protein
MKMKVKVSRLQAAIHKHVAQDQKRYEREMEKYKVKLAKARERHIQNVAAYLADLRRGGDIKSSYERNSVLDRGVDSPTKPKGPETYEALLVKLDLAEDQILVVDDHSDYMKFLDGKCVCR